MMSRKFEFEADLYACKLGYGLQLKLSLIKLFKESTSLIKPDIVFSWINNSHPNIHERIEAIDQYISGSKKDFEPIY